MSYSALEIWTVVFVVGIATFAIRFSFVALFGRVETVPPRVETALRYVPSAVLAALVVPSLLVVRPTLGATLVNAELLAGTVAVVAAWHTEDIFATIVVGMVTLHALRFVGVG